MILAMITGVVERRSAWSMISAGDQGCHLTAPTDQLGMLRGDQALVAQRRGVIVIIRSPVI